MFKIEFKNNATDIMEVVEVEKNPYAWVNENIGRFSHGISHVTVKRVN